MITVLKKIKAGEDTDNDLILNGDKEHLIISSSSLHYLLDGGAMSPLIDIREDKSKEEDLYILQATVEEAHHLVHTCFDAIDAGKKGELILGGETIIFNP